MSDKANEPELVAPEIFSGAVEEDGAIFDIALEGDDQDEEEEGEDDEDD